MYIEKDEHVVKEYIKVKNIGLAFHSQTFPTINKLVSWFKENFKTGEYRRFVKKSKAPHTSKIEFLIYLIIF